MGQTKLVRYRHKNPESKTYIWVTKNRKNETFLVSQIRKPRNGVRGLNLREQDEEGESV